MLMLMIDLAFVALGVVGTLVIQWILRRHNGPVTFTMNFEDSNPDKMWEQFDKTIRGPRD
jgi:hypothetical protein